ncbi:nuclear transport factor 2 family protein [Amphritea balenae]|uniref:SnoaL-like domain-containing protein n=1 Tax=Amphritea balenae TaxID=452629 RepID=A0A3P1SPK6_9GAMM|nr:hypothetical protein [Amphritea balenae]RRC98990.1 hypothetical protein EHS89_12545 [Amphritea balenae]GGK63468.1 polyketide cyclase [Amphritea balenae]
MSSKRKQQICELLKGIETGDPASVEVVNEAKYIQHNPHTQEGSIGLAELFQRLSLSNPRVNIVRVFEDGDFIFAHTEYDFSSSKIGFEIFRFENDQAVEHWDNIQPRRGPNPSKHSMVDGETKAVDLNKTEPNRLIVHSFIDEVLIKGRLNTLDHYIDGSNYTEHNPSMSDDLSALKASLSQPGSNGITYKKNHRLLAEGSFVLSVSEGYLNGVHSSFYDLFRVVDDMIVEHWDTTEAVPPRAEWKNDNGKF